MKLHLGEVVLVRMQFHQYAGAKIRPAVVLLNTGDDDFVAAPITSQIRSSDFDLAIGEWRSAGLNVASFVRIQKLTVLPKADATRTIGLLNDKERTQLADCSVQRFARETD